jgi:hypothetical protein
MVYVINRKSARLAVGQSCPPHALAKEIENVRASVKSGGVPDDHTAVPVGTVPPGRTPNVDGQRNLTFGLTPNPRRDRADRIAEIPAIPRSNWAPAPMREPVASMAQELGR